MMASYGLIGYPLSHSFSKKYFDQKFEQEKIDAEFLVFEIPKLAGFKELLPEDFKGCSVTIPYKEEIIPYLDDLDESAKAVGAVNSVQVKAGKLTGYNTDIIGFGESVKPLLHQNIQQALVFGSGGASKAVQYALQQINIPFQVVSRSAALNYENLTKEIIEEHQLLVNCTPLGMHPNVEECPEIPYESIGSDHLLFDLTYNPEETLFLQKGKAQGAIIKNGLEMLHLQAEASWDIWNS